MRSSICRANASHYLSVLTRFAAVTAGVDCCASFLAVDSSSSTNDFDSTPGEASTSAGGTSAKRARLLCPAIATGLVTIGSGRSENTSLCLTTPAI